MSQVHGRLIRPALAVLAAAGAMLVLTFRTDGAALDYDTGLVPQPRPTVILAKAGIHERDRWIRAESSSSSRPPPEAVSLARRSTTASATRLSTTSPPGLRPGLPYADG